jgi:hypothetical protein
VTFGARERSLLACVERAARAKGVPLDRWR